MASRIAQGLESDVEALIIVVHVGGESCCKGTAWEENHACLRSTEPLPKWECG